MVEESKLNLQRPDLEHKIGLTWQSALAQLAPALGPIQWVIDKRNGRPIFPLYIRDKSLEKFGDDLGTLIGVTGTIAFIIYTSLANSGIAYYVIDKIQDYTK